MNEEKRMHDIRGDLFNDWAISEYIATVPEQCQNAHRRFQIALNAPE